MPSHDTQHSCAACSHVPDSVLTSTNLTPVRGGGAPPTHLWMSGSGAHRTMCGVRMVSGVDVSEGMVGIKLAARPSRRMNKTKIVPLSHLRPYVSSLEGAPWAADDPADVDHVEMVRCFEPMCNTPATHNDGSVEHEYMCCRQHQQQLNIHRF